ncbi:MAG: carboxypeptidase-like regulatory domain-containing protein [Bacteroidia bacterium]
MILRRLAALYLIFQIHLSVAQTVTGSVIDPKTREPLAYVNIGVVGKGIGTVSDINGKFSIPLYDSVDDQTLRFSYIGYTNQSFRVSEFKKQFHNGGTIEMEANMVALQTVTVKPKVMKTKVLGNRNDSKRMMAGFKTNNLGCELGTIMRIKKAPTYIESVNFNIARNLIKDAKFRVNIYTMKDGQPDKNILPEAIYVTTSIESGTLTVDLKKYNLRVDGDFLVALEWIEDYGTGKLYFCAGLMDNNSMGRNTSQDKWQKSTPIGIGFNSTVSYEK